MDIALGVSGIGILLVLAFMVSARQLEREPLRDWPAIAKARLPYSTLTGSELKVIADREDFARAVIISAERQWVSKNWAHTPNRLREVLANDIHRMTEDTFALAEIGDLAGTAQHIILDAWARVAEERKGAA